MALQIALRIQQGAVFKKVIRWLDAEGKPKLIANWKGRMQIKPAYGSPDSVISLSTETGEIRLLDGYVILQLTAAQTRSIPVVYKSTGPSYKNYYYDLFLYSPDAQIQNQDVKRFMAGTVIVSGALTDAI